MKRPSIDDYSIAITWEHDDKDWEKFANDLESYVDALEEQVKNCSIPAVMGRSEQLTAFTEWLKDNHSIEIHDMILQDYIRYGD